MSITDNVLLLLFALFLVLLNGFFVAAEFAIVKVRHTRVEELSRIHGLRGRLLGTVHRNLDAYLSACQLGITLASLGLGWVGEPAFARLLEPALAALGVQLPPDSMHLVSFIIAFATISYLHIVIGELAPKSAAIRKPEVMSLWTAGPLFAFYWLMYPFIWFLNHSANAVLRRFGLQPQPGHGHEAPYTLDELRMILALSRGASDEKQLAATTEVSRMLAHTLELPHLHASDVMRNLREMVVIRSDDEAAAVRRLLQHHRYSRYPYVDAGNDEVLGVLHHKDIVFEQPGEDYQSRLRRHLRPVERVREDSPISDLLRQFRLGAPHLALVVDLDGRTIGFATMEDVLEAVFGDIRDEHEQFRPQQTRQPIRLDDGSLMVRGDTPLFMLERELGTELPESDTLSTVTGLFMERLDRMPQTGDTLEIADHHAEVLRTSGAAVEAVRLTKLGSGTDSSD